MGNQQLTEREHLRLKTTLRDMSMQAIHKLAEEYQVEIPMDAIDIYSIVDALVDALSSFDRRKLLDTFGDAGRKSTYLFVSKHPTPPLDELYVNAKRLLEIKNESQTWENYPYYDEVQLDHTNNSLKIRFHYLHGLTVVVDDIGRQREQRYQYSGVAVYRPGSKILEIRVRHKFMADKVAATMPIQLKIYPYETINLIDEKLIQSFVEWIRSLNSATIELASTDSTAGSLTITARKGMDLRTAEKFAKELKNGQLRGGHVTIEHNGNGINFRINFRDCHITYTLFTNETEISYIIGAFEKIIEGYTFAKPKNLLNFLGKNS